MDWTALVPVILLLLSTGVTKTFALQCYACGDSNTFSGQNQNHGSPLSCDEFERSEGEALKRFVIDCPANYVGCITQKQGDHLMRACDTYAFDDCQSANGITYCYCRGNLCNVPGVMQKTTTIMAHVDLTKITDLTDDEDYVDMSGNGAGDDIDTGKDLARHYEDYDQVVTSTNATELVESDVVWTTGTTKEVTENITLISSTTDSPTVPSIKHIKDVKDSLVVPRESTGNCTLLSNSLKTLILATLLKLLFYC